MNTRLLTLFTLASLAGCSLEGPGASGVELVIGDQTDISKNIVVDTVTAPDGAIITLWRDVDGEWERLGNESVPIGTVDQSLTMNVGFGPNTCYPDEQCIPGEHSIRALLHKRWDEAPMQIDSVPRYEDIDVTFTLNPGSSMELNRVDVSDQDASSGTSSTTIVIDRVEVAKSPAWLAMWSDDDGKPGTLLVESKLTREKLGGLQISMPSPPPGQNTIWVTLHDEDPKNGRFDFPDGDGDLPLTSLDGAPVQTSFLLSRPTLNEWDPPEEFFTLYADRFEWPRAYLADSQGWLVLRDNKTGAVMGYDRVSARSPNRILVRKLDVILNKYNDVSVELHDDYPRDNKFVESQDPISFNKSGEPMVWKGTLEFRSTVLDGDSEWHQYTCGDLGISQWTENRTELPVDCRCNDPLTGGLPICWSAYTAYNSGDVRIGEGTSFGTYPRPGTRFRGGFVDKVARELIMAVTWYDGAVVKNTGLIVAVDIDTADRRIVSGMDANSYATTGKGYETPIYNSSGVKSIDVPFGYLMDVKPGPDGYWYTFGSGGLTNTEIVRVDPKTGERKLVWKRFVPDSDYDKTYAQCYSERVSRSYPDGVPVAVNNEAFEIDAAGNFYLAFNNVGCANCEGIGVIKISPDGGTCSIVSRSDTGKSNVRSPNVGAGGPIGNNRLKGMDFIDGELWLSAEIGSALWAIDPDTGDRRVVSKDGLRGSGFPSIGEYSFEWDAAHGVVITSGDVRDKIVVVDPVTGNRTNIKGLDLTTNPPGGHAVPLQGDGPLNPSNFSTGQLFIDPDDSGFYYLPVDNVGILKYEIKTGNNYVWSL